MSKRGFLISVLILVLIANVISAQLDVMYNDENVPQAIIKKTIQFLDDLFDVDASSPANNECIVFTAATGLWEAKACPGGGGGGDFSFTDFDAAWLLNLTNHAPVNFTSQDFQGAFDLNFSDTSLFLNLTYLDGNTSFNQSFTDDRYLLVDGNGSTHNLTVTNNLSVLNELFANHTTILHYHTPQTDIEFNFYDDGSEIFLNSTVAEAFNIETDGSMLKLNDQPSAGNDFQLFQIFNKKAQLETEFTITQAGPELTSYIIRSFSLVGNGTFIPIPHNCSTFAENVDCETDITGPDFYVLDDVEVNGTIYAKEAIWINGTNISIWLFNQSENVWGDFNSSNFHAAWALNFTGNSPVNFTSQNFQAAFDANLSVESFGNFSSQQFNEAFVTNLTNHAP